MPKIPREKGYRKYNISKNRFREMYYFALQYHEWEDELKFKYDTVKAVTINDMPVAHNYEGDQTSDAAIECAELRHKINLVDTACLLADEALEPYIKKAVTNEGITYSYLQTVMNIPCSANTFYDRRRRFYWILSRNVKSENK